MAAKDNVKALVFDVFGTVVDWRASVIRELTAFGNGRGLNVERLRDSTLRQHGDKVGGHAEVRERADIINNGN